MYLLFRQLKFPSFVKDKEFRDLITLMLTKNVIQRLYKLSTIKEHLWFANFNWDGLINMSLPPPMTPKLKMTDFSSTMLFTKYVKVIKSI